MRIAVTGRNGQVASALFAAAAQAGCDIVALARPAFDLERLDSIAPAIAASGADLVVSAAAWTEVDRAESETARAHLVNAQAPRAIAAAARGIGAPVIHLSTDYVFDGLLDRPYRETDPVNPIGVYGASKLEGEQALASATPDHVILRTAWIYGDVGKNFVRTMLQLAETREEVGVVADQIGNPTYASDIAQAVLTVASRLVDSPGDRSLRGVFHMTASGETDWAGFAAAIFAGSATRGGPSCRVKPIATRDYPTAARRPPNSRLDCTRLAGAHGVTLPPWRDGLARCLERLIPTIDSSIVPRIIPSGGKQDS